MQKINIFKMVFDIHNGRSTRANHFELYLLYLSREKGGEGLAPLNLIIIFVCFDIRLHVAL